MGFASLGKRKKKRFHRGLERGARDEVGIRINKTLTLKERTILSS